MACSKTLSTMGERTEILKYEFLRNYVGTKKMVELRISLKHKGSEILITAKDPEEMEKLLESIPRLFKKIDDVMQDLAIREEEEVDYRDVIKIDEKGNPVLKVVGGDLTDKESIMLLLYPVENGLKGPDIGTQLNISGRVATGYAARLTELRREGIITRKTSGEYVLTERGKMMARDLVRKIKEVPQQ